MNALCSFLFLSTFVSNSVSVTVSQIQGPAWQSPYAGQVVTNLTGLVTAKGSSGFYISGDRVADIRVSNGLYVFNTSATILSQVAVGDKISLSGLVSEYRPNSSPNNLLLTELTKPTDIVVLSSNNTVTPLVLGKERNPPTQQLSALDNGPDGFLSIPNNSSRIEVVNATLEPTKYGLDFWESLEGQLVKIVSPVSLNFENQFGEFWAHGDWPVTGKNARGGLTITIGPDGKPDANPEVVMIGSPLDGTKNPKTAVGFNFKDIVGVVTYQFGFYYVLPLTAPVILTRPEEKQGPTTLKSSISNGCELSFGDYNVENMNPNSSHIPAVADHIANYMLTPDLLFLQEVQDNSGATNDGTTSGNLTLTALVNAIAKVSNVTYSFLEIAPLDGQDGGQPGGNIRQAYLYRPSKLSLVKGSPVGGSTDATKVIGNHGAPKLSFNPGRIDPGHAAWNDSRKPLVAQWKTKRGQDLFTINVHFSSKGGSSSTQGDARSPVNAPVDQRLSQMSKVGSFVESILKKAPSANIILAGDFNEFSQARTVFEPITKHLIEIEDAAKIPTIERYTYVFDQSNQQLDHIFISKGVAKRKVQAEHLHVNNWSLLYADRVSDHDPTVAKVHFC